MSETPDATPPQADSPDPAAGTDDGLAEVTLAALPPELQAAAARAGWTELMPVQCRAIPYMLAKRDMMVQSRTGSGKTGAFVLPMLERLDKDRKQCQALVLVPTRELARQVAAHTDTLCGDSGFFCAAVYGGVGFAPQMERIRQGAQIVVGTPGRILDHLLRRTLTLDGLEILVFDEADRMLSMGFYPDMVQVRQYLPRRRVNACMFSATFPPFVMRLAQRFLHEPEKISLSRDHVHVVETDHVYYTVPAMDKDRCLVRIIEIENPQNAIIFCNTKSNVHYVSVVLQRFGYDADELSSDLSQKLREKVLARGREGKLRFLVATDVAARGLDIPELSHIFQYDVSEDPEGYIHRAGRTGRAGASGRAVTLASGMDIVAIRQLEKRYQIDFIERPLPSDEDVAALVSERLTALLEARLRTRDNLERERMQRFVALGRSLAENEDESEVIAMLLDEYYQRSLQTPPAPPDSPAAATPSSPAPEDHSYSRGRGPKRHHRGRRRR